MQNDLFKKLVKLTDDKKKKSQLYFFYKEEVEKAFSIKFEEEKPDIISEVSSEKVEAIIEKTTSEKQSDKKTDEESDLFSTFGEGIRELKFDDSKSEN